MAARSPASSLRPVSLAVERDSELGINVTAMSSGLVLCVCDRRNRSGLPFLLQWAIGPMTALAAFDQVLQHLTHRLHGYQRSDQLITVL